MKLFLVINLVVFQLCWFLAATYQHNSVLIIVGLLGIHFLCSPTKLADVKVLPIALVGVVVDQLLIILQVIQLPSDSTSPLTIPLWLILLWCIFSWCFMGWFVNVFVVRSFSKSFGIDRNFKNTYDPVITGV